MWYTVLIVLHVIVCTFLILVVLLQAGKGGGMGIAFGGGGSQTVFGSSGAGNFLTRLTAICAAIFIGNSLLLAYMSSQHDSKRLQELAEKKTADKKAQEAASSKAMTDLEKARQAAEKTSAAAPAAATTAETPGAAPAPSAPTDGTKAPEKAETKATEKPETKAAEKPETKAAEQPKAGSADKPVTETKPRTRAKPPKTSPAETEAAEGTTAQPGADNK
jgi:preprotein translocase subunit SecG